MIKNYHVNDNNWVVYERIEDMIVVLFMFFDDPVRISSDVKTYFDMFANETDAVFLTTYPGTQTPPVAKAHLDVIKQYGLPYRLYYDEQEITNKTAFENSFFAMPEVVGKGMKASQSPQSACDNNFALKCKESGIKPCGICSPLRSGVNYVRSPVKYYRLDADGFLVEEYLEKPDGKFPMYQSMRLSQKFREHRIQRVEDKLKYLPK